jgi:hypothetical protein
VQPAYDQALPVRAIIDGPMAGVALVTPGFKPVRCKEWPTSARAPPSDAARLFGAGCRPRDRGHGEVDVVRPDTLGGKARRSSTGACPRTTRARDPPRRPPPSSTTGGRTGEAAAR